MIGFQLGHTNKLSSASKSADVRPAGGVHSPLVVVDGVAEPRRVHDGQLELHSFLLDVYSVFDELYGLVNALCKASTQRQLEKWHLMKIKYERLLLKNS